MIERQNSILLITTPLIIIGLVYIAAHDPLLAVLNSAFTVALVFNMLMKTAGTAPIAVSICTGIALIVFSKVSWLSLLFLAAIMTGMLYPLLVQRRVREDDYMYVGTGIFLAYFFILIGLRYATYGQSPLDALQALMAQILNNIEEVLKEGLQSGTPGGQQQLFENWPQYKNSLPYYLVGSALSLWMLVTYGVTRMIRRHLKGADSPVPPFPFFRIKEQYLFVLIFGIVMEILGRLQNHESFFYISRAIFLFAGITYFLVGLSLIAYLFLVKQTQAKSPFSPILKLVLLLVIVFQPYICAILGLLDVWFDFRKLSKPVRNRVA